MGNYKAVSLDKFTQFTFVLLKQKQVDRVAKRTPTMDKIMSWNKWHPWDIVNKMCSSGQLH